MRSTEAAAEPGAGATGTRRGMILCGAGVLLGGAALSADPSRAAPARLVDLMPDFWRAWDSSRSLAADAVPEALLARFFAPHADVYEGAGVKFDQARVARWVGRVSPHIPAIRRLSARFSAAFDLHVRHFARTFPDFDPGAAPIYLMPSLGRFDGHLQPWGKLEPLFVGPDGLVFAHGDDPDLAVFLDHETFHLYHHQKTPDLDAGDDQLPMYVILWIEGLATYVSQALNPEAPRLHVLLDDRALDAAGDDVVRKVASELLGRLDSPSDADYARYFQAASHASDIPARAGYLVGLLVAQGAAPGRSLPQLARLDRAAVRAIVAEQLQAIKETGGRARTR